MAFLESLATGSRAMWRTACAGGHDSCGGHARAVGATLAHLSRISRAQPCLSHRVHYAQAPSAAVGTPAPASRPAVSQQRFGQQPSLGTTFSYKLPTQNKSAEKAASRVMKRQRNESQWERLREPLRLASLEADGRARRLLRSSAGAKDLQKACQLKGCNRCGSPHFTERAQATISPACRPAVPRSLCAYIA